MAKQLFELLTDENPVLTTFLCWSAFLVVKVLLMGPLTAFQRHRTKTFANPEDLALSRGQQEIRFGNEDVERVRRAHRNDLENVLPYLIVGFFYVLTDPPVAVATWLIKIATVARFAHTLVYAVVVIPQPARGLCFTIHAGITIYFAIACIIRFI